VQQVVAVNQERHTAIVIDRRAGVGIGFQRELG
jgi:hypothetical protein